jgi:hypothetical protein
VAAHPVGDHEQPEIQLAHKDVFVYQSNAPWMGDSSGFDHKSLPAKVARWSTGAAKRLQ